MARVRRWREKFLLIWFTMFASLAWARPRARTPADAPRAVHSISVSGAPGKAALVVALSAAKPYVRVFNAASSPITMPKNVGAFAAGAAAVGLAGAVAAASGSCAVCNTATAQFCSRTDASCCNPRNPGCTYTTLDGACSGGGSCHPIQCSNFEASNIVCYTCGHGTCTASCFPY